ncbi:MAG: class I SAM-dependent RNA methyltransferase [Chloroflexi bacterium]|nr:class I SAM-dependent RNA methyltransferase [Chloroflexota bacterium]
MTVDLLTIKLEKLTCGGDALGRLPDGRAAFVPFALPGETVRARVVEERRGHVRMELVEVLEASPERIVPKCRHFGACGGCHYQHLPYETQLKAKSEIVRDQLARIGKIENPPVQEMIASPVQWNYRNHIQFHLTKDGKLGYVGVDGRRVVPISECHLPEPKLDALWPGLQFEPGLGLERVSLRLGAEGDVMLLLESPEPPELEVEADLSVVHLLGDEAVVMAGDDHVVMVVKERPFRVSAGAFFQVNAAMAGKMVTHLLERLPVTPQTTLLDVYCGVGLFSAFFAGRVRRLAGIEVSPAACEDFAANLDEFENVELYQAPAEDVLPYLDLKPDIVIVDPPRAGLEKRVLDAVQARGPERIAYVSCDPSTLARDASRFIAGGYRLVEVTPFDLFPQTYHIESISIFEKASQKS